MSRQAKVHLILTFLWAAMIIPTVLIFRNSVLYVAVVSIYALVASHWGAYEAARAGIQGGTLRQIRAVADALADMMESYERVHPDVDLRLAIDELRTSLDEDEDSADHQGHT